MIHMIMMFGATTLQQQRATTTCNNFSVKFGKKTQEESYLINDSDDNDAWCSNSATFLSKQNNKNGQ